VLPECGPVVAPPGVTPDAWMRALPVEAVPFVVAPASSRGWFEGRTLVAWSPSCFAAGLAEREAAEALDATFSSTGPSLAVALLPYGSTCTVAQYTGGLMLTTEGWCTWGTLTPADVPALGPVESRLPRAAPLAVRVWTDMDAEGFRAGVRAIREDILAGDYYVLNLTRRLTGTPAVAPVAAFAALLDRTHADMAAFWATPAFTLASASPERFLRVSGDRVQVCPIKGTRPRASGDADEAMATALASSVKERAEHVMIVDMERNDLGRVCRPGTVSVEGLFEVVATRYCHQMVSTVHGRLRGGVTLGDLLEAAFPCGSVTGAPKIAAMRAIADLESSPRGAYTGSLMVAMPGELDSSVLIRTAEYADGVVRWGTGGGITVDSDPEEEWSETMLKASPFLGMSGEGRGPGDGREAT